MAIVLNCQPGLANLESQEDNSGDYSDISDYCYYLPWVNLLHFHSRVDREASFQQDRQRPERVI
jgi:hypothetical protein